MRIDDIVQAGLIQYPHRWSGDHENGQRLDAFCEGAEWADKNPSEELIFRIQILICEWNFGGIDKTPYKDVFEYIKSKLHETGNVCSN